MSRNNKFQSKSFKKLKNIEIWTKWKIGRVVFKIIGGFQDVGPKTGDKLCHALLTLNEVYNTYPLLIPAERT